MSRKTLLMSVLLTVSLTACASGEADRQAPTDQAVPSAVEETSTGPTHSLPVASAFGEPAWGMQIPPSWEQMTPTVTAQRVIALSDATVVAYDTRGEEAWATDWKPLAEQDRAVGTPPVLRQVSPEVVAVIDTGKVEGEGLATSTYAAQVTLISIGDGALIEEVTVPGSESDTPELAEIGLGFAWPDRSAVIVTPEGEIVEAPAAHADARLVGAVSVGQHPIGLWETGSVSTLSSFGGSGWSSDDLLPNEATTNAQVFGSDADTLVLGRWNEPTAGRGEGGEVAFQVLDAASGEVLATPECGPATASPFVVSPNSEWKVAGSLRLSPQNTGDCTGGGEGQRSVTFSAVTDEGRAFGLAGQGGSDALFVDSRPGEEPETSDLPEGARPPIGVMEGGLAVHWDAKTGVITANPIQE